MLGTLYSIIAPAAGWYTPSANNIIAGLGPTGATATWSGNTADPNSSGQFNWPTEATGLSASTLYGIAFVWKDSNNNYSEVVTGVFTTLAGGLTLSSDILTTGWFPVPADGTLYNKVNESTPDDGNYIYSSTTTEQVVFGLSQALAAGTYTISTRANKSGTAGQIRVVLLNDSNVVQGTSSWTVLSDTFTTYPISVTTTGSATRVRLELQ